MTINTQDITYYGSQVYVYVYMYATCTSPWTGQFLDPNIILRSNQTMKIEDSYRRMLHDDEHSE